jgi:hypothetical protein
MAEAPTQLAIILNSVFKDSTPDSSSLLSQFDLQGFPFFYLSSSGAMPSAASLLAVCLLVATQTLALTLGALTLDNSTACRGEAFRPNQRDPYLDYICDRIDDVCACGRAHEIRAAAARAKKNPPKIVDRPRKVCAIVRTYVGHAPTIQLTLETLLASVRTAFDNNQKGGGLTLETHILNTDKRALDPAFIAKLTAVVKKTKVAKGGGPDYEAHMAHYKDVRPWLPPGVKGDFFGFIATDLLLLHLRARGGCDFILATNGDNAYHVDFFRHVLHEMDGGGGGSSTTKKTKAAGALAPRASDTSIAAVTVNYWCHYPRVQRESKGVTHARFERGHNDLGATVYRAAYMDAKNETFALSHTELHVGNRIDVADGWIVRRIRLDVGDERVKAVNETLYFHI